MIIRLQATIFFMIGVMCWHGVDDVVKTARADAKASMLLAMPINAISTIDTREM